MSTSNSNQSDLTNTLAITAYREGPAIVRQKQELSLCVSVSQASLDLIKGFVPGSLTITKIEGEGAVEISTISYKPANLTTEQMLKGSIGQDISIIDPDYPEETNGLVGTLVHVLNRSLVLSAGDRLAIVPIAEQQRYNLPAHTLAKLAKHPTLKIEVSATLSGEYMLDVLYAVEGLVWTNRFEVFYESQTDTITKFACWVELTNATGSSITEATFQLIEGANVDGENQNRNRLRGNVRSLALAADDHSHFESFSSGPGAAVEDIGEQTIYTLPQSFDLQSGESKQLSLFAVKDVPILVEYFLPEGRYSTARENEDKLPVFKSLKINNERLSNLGFAIPSGSVRIFEADNNAEYHCTDHTKITSPVAVAETFKLTLAKPSKTIKATRRLLAKNDEEVTKDLPEIDLDGAKHTVANAGHKADSAKTETVTYQKQQREIELFNYKASLIAVVIYESLPTSELEFIVPVEGAAEVEQAVGGAKITVLIPANSSVKVSYTIRFRLN